VLPAPAEAPFTFDATTVQVYVVPATEFGLVMDTDVVDPEQIVCALAAA
jgi:hypothetical protein